MLQFVQSTLKSGGTEAQFVELSGSKLEATQNAKGALEIKGVELTPVAWCARTKSNKPRREYEGYTKFTFSHDQHFKLCDGWKRSSSDRRAPMECKSKTPFEIKDKRARKAAWKAVNNKVNDWNSKYPMDRIRMTAFTG